MTDQQPAPTAAADTPGHLPVQPGRVHHQHSVSDTADEAGLAMHLQMTHGLFPSGDPDADAAAHDAAHGPTDAEASAVSLRLLYDRVRIGGRNGISFFRCVRCRGLLEETLREQEEHEAWHAARGENAAEYLAAVDANSGW